MTRGMFPNHIETKAILAREILKLERQTRSLHYGVVLPLLLCLVLQPYRCIMYVVSCFCFFSWWLQAHVVFRFVPKWVQYYIMKQLRSGAFFIYQSKTEANPFFPLNSSLFLPSILPPFSPSLFLRFLSCLLSSPLLYFPSLIQLSWLIPHFVEIHTRYQLSSRCLPYKTQCPLLCAKIFRASPAGWFRYQKSISSCT